jgi:hypothetical protein
MLVQAGVLLEGPRMGYAEVKLSGNCDESKVKEARWPESAQAERQPGLRAMSRPTHSHAQNRSTRFSIARAGGRTTATSATIDEACP